MSDRNKGFTLVELLIVLAIISILAGIAIPALLQYTQRARISAAKATLDNVKKALLILETDTGLWPGGNTPAVCKQAGNEYSNLVANNIGLFNNNGSAFTGWRGPYLEASHLSNGDFTDPWGSRYFMDCDYNINGTDYVVVGSFGPNRVGLNVYDSDNVYVIISSRN